MKFYQFVDFVPEMKVTGKSKADQKREAWLEEVACAILNNTRENCCLTTRSIIEMLVDLKRNDLLPCQGKKFLTVEQMVGGMTNKLRAVVPPDFILINQIAVTQIPVELRHC